MGKDNGEGGPTAVEPLPAFYTRLARI